MLTSLYAKLDRFAQRMEHFAVSQARLVVAVGIMLGVVAVYAATNLVFANDYRVFFDVNDPQRVAQEQAEARFTGSDSVTFVLTAKQGDLFSRHGMQAIAEATAAAGAMPHVSRVDSLANHQHSRGVGDELIVAPLVEDPDTLDSTALARIRAVALTDPAIQGRYLSKDGRTAQIVATVQLPEGDPAAMKAVGAAAAQLKSRLAYAYPELHVASSGVILLSNSFYSVTQSDMLRLVPMMSLMLAVSIALFFRSIPASIAAMSTLGLSILVTIGFAAALGVAMSPASAQAPVIVLTIATAEAIHIIGNVQAQQRRGASRAGAVEGALRANHAAIFITTLTDVFGFLSFNFSDTPPFRDLGNLCAAGAVIAYFYSLMFLPAVLTLWPFQVHDELLEREHNVARVARWAMRHARLTLSAMLLMTLAFGAIWPTIRTRDNFVEWLGPSHSFRQDAEYINARLPGIYAMTYVLDSGEDGGIADPAYLARVERFQRWLEKQPEVADVASLVDVMQRLNRNMHGDDPAWNRLPDSRDLAAQYLLLYEMSLTQGKDLSDQITPDKRASRLFISLKDVSSEEMVSLRDRADAWLVDNVPPRMRAKATGTSLMFATLTQENTHAMIAGTMVAVLTIAVVTGMALLSARMGLIALLPALAPVAMAFGAWALIVGEQGLYAAFVISCSLGLTVDSVTHFTMKFHDAWQDKGMSTEDAVSHAYQGVGMELWIASIILIIGFLMLSFSDFAIIAKLGQMVALIFVFSLITTFMMLPALLKWLVPAYAKPRAQTEDQPGPWLG